MRLIIATGAKSNETQPQPLLDVLVNAAVAVEMNQLPYWFHIWGRRVYFGLAVLVLIFVAVMLTSCGSVRCDLLGSDSLRDECENGVMVKVYSVPTWIPGQDNTLRSLWQADKAAQHGGLY